MGAVSPMPSITRGTVLRAGRAVLVVVGLGVAALTV